MITVSLTVVSSKHKPFAYFTIALYSVSSVGVVVIVVVTSPANKVHAPNVALFSSQRIESPT